MSVKYYLFVIAAILIKYKKKQKKQINNLREDPIKEKKYCVSIFMYMGKRHYTTVKKEDYSKEMIWLMKYYSM